MKLSEALEYEREWHQPPILDNVEAARDLEARVAELEDAIGEALGELTNGHPADQILRKPFEPKP